MCVHMCVKCQEEGNIIEDVMHYPAICGVGACMCAGS